MATESFVTLLLFASARDAIPDEPQSLELPLPHVEYETSSTVKTVRESLKTLALSNGWVKFLDVLDRSLFAVDDQMAPLEQEANIAVHAHHLLAVIPPCRMTYEGAIV
ncbi:uncharacterized protein MELLADRAFT_109385 [Melampsora larici-populina 98AG31]|uniref:Uncharacterized protein n=1 Tax=Melampsora larici-populina (strain 98AG31 / pathotype 3-4-7) TaxID=747676 RepID=F4RWA7_MELLP|nr:uncharacterized protein MELLADRAFT_109385 [Melampsora larici-populina 98AG31]EGG03355.1 hypothetical protein MELLADRAFT_109385 [Melampsora larici-populina 98AG31]